MPTVAIAQPSATISALIGVIVELRGDTAIAYDAAEAQAQMYDAAIVDPAWDTGLAFARGARQLDANLPIVCVSNWSPTPEARALRPAAYLRMPFQVGELNAALDAALGPGAPK